jgi:hypothetical protein
MKSKSIMAWHAVIQTEHNTTGIHQLDEVELEVRSQKTANNQQLFLNPNSH